MTHHEHGLLGRGPECARLATALDPERRDGTAIAVSASHGRGMTSLLAWTAGLGGQRGFRVLRAAGHRDEQDLAGFGLHQLMQPLRTLITVVSEAERPAARAAVTLRMPPGADAAATLRSGARALVTAAARQGPVLIVVDDTHHLDAASTVVVRDLIGLTAVLPIVVLLGVRSRNTAVLRTPGMTVLALEPLSDVDAATLLDRHPGVPRGRGRREILRRARGNPRAVVDLAAAFAGASGDEVLSMPLARTLPLRQRHAAELAALPPGVLRLTRQAGAMTGGEQESDVVAAAAASDQDVRLALDLGALERHGRTLVIADPLAEIAAYMSCPAAERATLHHRFAAVLPAGSLAHARHLAAAASGPSEPVAAALEAAGPADADALQRAAELSPAPADATRRYAAAIEAAAVIGQSSWVLELHAALSAIDGAAALAPATARSAAFAFSRLGRQREAMDLLVDGFRRHRPVDRTDALLLAGAAAHIARFSGLPEHRQVVATLLEHSDRLPGAGNALLHEAVRATADPAAMMPPVDLRPDPDPHITALLAYRADAAGDLATAVRLREHAIASAPGAGVVESRLPLGIDVGDQGRWDRGAELIEQAGALCALADLPLVQAEVNANAALLAALRGDGAGARRLAEKAWNGVDLHQNRRLRYHLERASANAAFAEGDYGSAYRHFRNLFDVDSERYHPDGGAHALIGLIITAPHAGREAEAAALVASFDGPPTTRIRLLLAHARARLVEDEHTGEHFREALADPRGEVWVFERALTRLHYGGWLRRRRRMLEARAQLVLALESLEATGSGPLTEIARSELRAAGQTVTTAVRESGDDPLRSLSPQQRQIIRLAARGLRNREIAAQLRVSPRTVGTHLYNAYPKLGVRGRHELGPLLEAS